VADRPNPRTGVRPSEIRDAIDDAATRDKNHDKVAGENPYRRTDASHRRDATADKLESAIGKGWPFKKR
jgi:hypothetical protein